MSIITEDEDIRDILAQVRRIAVVGLSPDPKRPSHGVAKGMIENGYEIIPVNPKIDKVLGRETLSNLRCIGNTINMVNVFRNPKYVPEIVELCIEKHICNLWLQEGVIHRQAAEHAANHGIRVVMDRCMLKEYNRLLG